MRPLLYLFACVAGGEQGRIYSKNTPPPTGQPGAPERSLPAVVWCDPPAFARIHDGRVPIPDTGRQGGVSRAFPSHLSLPLPIPPVLEGEHADPPLPPIMMPPIMNVCAMPRM